MSPDILEVFRQWSFLSSLLAGFAITVAIELISLRQKRQKKPLVSAAIALFLVSAVVLTAQTFIFLTGIGLVGWIRSKILGIITTISAALAFVTVIWVMSSVR